MTERIAAPPGPSASLRVQILATEHWALLAARTTTQNEVLTRIGLSLTTLSAALVTVGLLGSALGFGRPFAAATFGIVCLVWLIGFLTLVRVLNASEDDAMYVLAMNRLRGAYVEADPGIEPELIQSQYDDMAGLSATYAYGGRSPARQVLGSTSAFMLVLCAVLTGLLVAAAVATLGGRFGTMLGSGAAAAGLFAISIGTLEGRRVARKQRRWVPRRQTPTTETRST